MLKRLKIMVNKEKWGIISNTNELYRISTNGIILSKAKGKSERLLYPKKCRKGYLRVGINTIYGRKNMAIHRLVALTFLENPENKKEVNHINGIKHDNRVENLEWATASENQLHSFKFLGREGGLKGKTGRMHHKSKLVKCPT